MTTETATQPEQPQAQAAPAPAKWWCNFCGFATDDQQEYLQHSCVDVIKQQGRTVAPAGQNECR